jgi:membrane protease YdiL (CAAX protease family)
MSRDLAMIAVFYVVIVVLMRLAFVTFGTDHVAALFLSFAGALLVGVLGPVYYTVWTRGGSLAELGIRRDNWRPTLVLALLFAAVQFAITLWGYALPAPVDWVPLLVMALVVGVFESIFFRGFIQNRLAARFGSRAAIGGAAVLYGAYHVGYGMGLTDVAFLTGLGVTYAVAFAVARNVLVLWPLLTPMGSFYAQLKNADIELPWASILGFADVAIVMIGALWIAHRHENKRPPGPAAAPPEYLLEAGT